MDLKPKYRHALDGISQIPSLPNLVSRLLLVLNHPRSSVEDVTHILEMDVGLSGKIMRLANSAYYGVPGEINSIHRAVVKLGFNAISSIVISASVYSLFKTTTQTATMNRIAFWRHSIEVAIYSRVIAQQLHSIRLDPEIAFTQGMLHDVGALALDVIFPEEYATLIDGVRKHGRHLEEAESELFGLNHSQIGARILSRWGIPDVICTPVEEHHDMHPSAQYLDYTRALALANGVSHMRGSGLYPQQKHPLFSMDEALRLLGITTSTEQLSALFDEELKKASLVMNLLRS